MTRLFCALGSILCALTGCLPIPDTGTTDQLDFPAALSSPMIAGDQLAILGNKDLGDDHDITNCVRSAAAKTDATLHIMPPQMFRDSLFPWFEASTTPRNAEVLSSTINQPAVKAKISELNVHYVVIIGGGTDDVHDSKAPEFRHRSTRISGRILDLKDARWPGSIDMLVSATGTVQQAGILTVIVIPITETTACQEFGRQLVAYLTGHPIPE